MYSEKTQMALEYYPNQFKFSMSNRQFAGGDSYIIEDMDVRQGLSNPYLCRPEFGQNFAPFAAKWRKIFKNIYPKTAENEFLAIYLCIIEKEFVKSLLFDQENYYFTKFETLIT